MGAVSGAVTAGIGSALAPVGTGILANSNALYEVWRAGWHGLSQGMISTTFGGDFYAGFFSGSIGSLAGSATMLYAPGIMNNPIGVYTYSALAGGIGAELTGGNFWQGAAIGLMNAGLNHEGNKAAKAITKKIEENSSNRGNNKMTGRWHGKDGTYYYDLNGKLVMIEYKDGTIKVSREFSRDKGLPIPKDIKSNPKYEYYYKVGYYGNLKQRLQYYFLVIGSAYTNSHGVGFDTLVPDKNAMISGYEQGMYDYKKNYLPEF